MARTVKPTLGLILHWTAAISILQIIFVWLAVALGAGAVGLALSWAIPILVAFAASFYWFIRLERFNRIGTSDAVSARLLEIF